MHYGEHKFNSVVVFDVSSHRGSSSQVSPFGLAPEDSKLAHPVSQCHNIKTTDGYSEPTSYRDS